MANQNTIFDFSTTPASNLNAKGQSMRGTALANTIDSVFQNEASMLKAFYDSLGGAATVSGTDTYTVTVTEDWAAYASGLVLAIKVPNANTGASTLNVTVPTAGALGAKAIRRQGDSALSANDMVANGVYLLRYSTSYNSSAGAWVLMNPASSSVSLPITEANGGTNQTTYTQGDLLYASAPNALSKLAKGSTGQALTQTSTIPAWASVVTLGTSVATTSGTSIDYTSLPSWIRKIVVNFSGVSLSGTSDLLVQIGDSGGIETTGYVGGSALVISGGATQFSSSTAGFAIRSGNASNVFHGSVTLNLTDSSTALWVAEIALASSANSFSVVGGGTKTVSAAPVDRLRITTVNGTDTFDAGTVNISYE